MINLTGIDSDLEFKGTFPAVCHEVSEKTSQNNNRMVVVVFKVIGDKFNNYKVTERYVLDSEMGKKKLANLVDSIGLDREFELGDLHNKKVNIKVTPDKDGYSKVKLTEKYVEPEVAV